MIRAALLTSMLVACSSETGLRSLSFEVDPDGGSFENERLVMVVPPGAVPEGVTITATPSGTAPAGILAASPTWTFAPDGLVFATPITVRMKHEDRSAALSVFWTDEVGAFGVIPTTFPTAGWAEALVAHFSEGVVGEDGSGCEDDDDDDGDHDEDRDHPRGRGDCDDDDGEDDDGEDDDGRDDDDDTDDDDGRDDDDDTDDDDTDDDDGRDD